LESETDEWILDRLALGLSEILSDHLNPLFLELLGHESPNVRWRAVQHFSYGEDPATIPHLLRLWRSEERPRVRTDLLEALRMQEASGYAEDCLDLVEDEDTELALAAIQALGEQAPPGATERLVDLSRDGRRLPLRAAAIAALGRIDHRTAGLDAILQATHDPSPHVAVAATTALDGIEDDRAEARLLELARAAPLPLLREHALLGLSRDTMSPRVQELFVELEAEEPRPDNGLLRYFASSALHSAGLRADPPLQVDPTYAAVSLPPAEPPWILVPPAGTDTVRCWRGPDLAGDPAERLRLERGLLVVPNDWFEEGEGRLWVEARRYCWIPFENLARSDESPVRDERTLRAELDLLVEDLDTRVVTELQSSGLLETFDTTERVTGVALEVDPVDTEQVEAFCQALDGVTGLLADAADVMLRTLCSEPHGALARDVPPE
jgi:hypothetical protein